MNSYWIKYLAEGPQDEEEEDDKDEEENPNQPVG